MSTFNERIEMARKAARDMWDKGSKTMLHCLLVALDALKEPEVKPAEPAWTPKVGEWAWCGSVVKIKSIDEKGMIEIGENAFSHASMLRPATSEQIRRHKEQEAEPLVRHPDGRVWYVDGDGNTSILDEEKSAWPKSPYRPMTRPEAFRKGALARFEGGEFIYQARINHVTDSVVVYFDRIDWVGESVQMGRSITDPNLTLVEPAPEDSDE